MPSEQWEVVSTVTVEASGASIADGAAAFADDAVIANDTDKCPFVEVELQWTHSVAPADGQPIEVYGITKPDATNEVDASVNAPPASARVGTISGRAVTSGQRQQTVGPALPFSTRLWLVNRTGQTISAGWIAKVKTLRRKTV